MMISRDAHKNLVPLGMVLLASACPTSTTDPTTSATTGPLTTGSTTAPTTTTAQPTSNTVTSETSTTASLSGTSSTSTSSTSTSSTSSSSTSNSTDSTTFTTTEAGTTSDMSTDSGTGSTTSDWSECPPGDNPTATFSISVTDGKWHPDFWGTDGYQCVIQEVNGNASVLFDCVDKVGDPVDPITLSVWGDPPPTLAAFVPGTSVRFDYVKDNTGPFINCTFFDALRIERMDSVLLLAAQGAAIISRSTHFRRRRSPLERRFVSIPTALRVPAVGTLSISPTSISATV